MLKYKSNAVLSPEQALGQQTSSKTDVFQLGSLLETLIIGEEPDYVNNHDELANFIRPVTVQCRNKLQPFIEQCLVKNPEQRLTMKQLYLRFPWLSDLSRSEQESNEPLRQVPVEIQ